jgi:colanic acid/amylovoran biosynthesis glycosyltransferase
LYGLDSLALGPLQRAATARAIGPVDAIVAHFGPNGLKALQLRELGITAAPIVTLFHGHDLSRWTRRHGPRGYRRLFSESERMLAISEHGRSKLVELGCPPDKVGVHRVGVDVSVRLWTPPRSGDARPSGFRLLSVGRLVEKKGFEFALRAVRLALTRYPELRYELIGDGPLRAALEALASRLGIAHRVRFHGHLAREAVESIRSRADLLLVPSVTSTDGDEEGIPVVLMEAMAAGVPVIATRHGAIPELVIDNDTGLLVPERDSQALADALTRMMGDSHLRARLARGARKRVVAQHDLTRQNDELLRLLAGLARRRRESHDL